MRQTFIDTLTKLAEKDKNIYLLTGDLGFSFFENFARKFPQRFINCGVAEQNMIGIAAGLALNKKKVYVYSIIPFVTIRCLEQIKNDIVYPNLDIKIVGVGTGFSYGPLGATHQATEDIAVLRTLPNMTVLCPADPIETEELILESYKTKTPTYIRLDKSGKKRLYNFRPNIVIGKPTVLKTGKHGLIITTGTHLDIGIGLVKKLKNRGYDFKLISMHTLKPIDEKALINEIKEQNLIFTLEEHNLIGGLGSAVGEILLKHNINNIRLKSIGISDIDQNAIGTQDYLRKHYKIDKDSIYEQIIESLKKHEK